MPRKLLIDTDTASDDAVALIMALRSREVEVVAITVVAGNVAVDQATRNALLTTELCGADVPVYTGAAQPLQRPLQPAHWFHGQDGLGDHGFRPHRRDAETTHAATAIVEAARKHPGLEIITLGPLTNIALALKQEPRLPELVGRVVVMGGAPACEGNVTPAAEFNLWVDPEAARAVFLSALPLELVGWQLSRHAAVLNEADIAEIAALDSPLARFTLESNSRAKEAFLEQTGEHGISLPDPVAMALLLDPALGTRWSEHYVQIEAGSELTRGMSVVDVLNVTHDHRNADVWTETRARAKPVRVYWELNVPGWKQLLLRSL